MAAQTSVEESILKYYPVFLDISGEKCVIVGGGRVAERKAGRLFSCGAHVVVIARKATALLEEMNREGKIVLVASDYDRSALDGAFLAFAATNDAAVNRQVAMDARAAGVLANVADAPDRCDFIVPSVVERGELTIAVSTGGSSPAVARKIRKELETLYGEEYSELLRIMGKLRETIIAEGRDSDENREKFELLAGSDILDCIREGRMADADAIIERLTGVGMEVKKG